MKKILIASVSAVVVILLARPVVGFLLEYGITAGVFAAKDKADLAIGAKYIAYALGGLVFYIKVRKENS